MNSCVGYKHGIEIKYFTTENHRNVKLVSCYIKKSVCSTIVMIKIFHVKYESDSVFLCVFNVC